MSVHFIRLLELQSIEQQNDRYYLNTIITIDEPVHLFWEVDANTALQLMNACEFDGKYRFRLSLRTKMDTTKETLQSYITKTYLDKSTRVHFSCSDDYRRQIHHLKTCTTIEQLKALPFLYEEIPTIEPEIEDEIEDEVEEPLIEELPPEIEVEHEETQPTEEEVVVEEDQQETETEETTDSVHSSEMEQPKVETTIDERKETVDGEEEHTTTEDVEQHVQLSDEVHSKKEEPTFPQQRKSKKWFLVSLVSIAIIGLILYFIFSSKTPKTENSVNNHETSSGSEIRTHSVEELITFALPEGFVALTFNGGPTKYTPKIIEILKEHEVNGHFFFLNSQVEKLPKTVEYTYTNDFSIGCMTEESMVSLPLEQQEEQLVKVKGAIEEITEETVQLYRPIDGLFNEHTKNALENQQLKLVHWNVDPLESRALSSNDIVEYIEKQELSGSILVFNETNDVIEALPAIIELIQQQNYQIVRLE